MDKATLEDCIRSTNRVIYRWLNIHNVKPSQIYKSDVESIFYGYIKKWVVKNKYDFKNVKRYIHVFTDETTKFVSSVTIIDAGYYIRDKVAFDEMKAILLTINFSNLIPTAENFEGLSPEELADLDTISVNFKSIESIKF